MAEKMSVTDFSNIAKPQSKMRTTGSDASKARRKFARSTSKSWFNKSFDQAVANQASKPPLVKSIRRQNSVSDFFQGVFSRSRSTLQDIFSTKKDRNKSKSPSLDQMLLKFPNHGADLTSDSPVRAEGVDTNSLYADDLSLQNAYTYNSCPNFSEPETDSLDTSEVNVQVIPDPFMVDHSYSDEKSRKPSPSPSFEATFMSTGTPPARNMLEEITLGNIQGHRRMFKKSSSTPHRTSSPRDSLSSPTTLSPRRTPNRRKTSKAEVSSPWRCHPPKIVTLSSHDSSDSADEGRGSRYTSAQYISGGGRASMTSITALLPSDDIISRAKRALVKSNSDTFARNRTSSPMHLSKASSDGNCFGHKSTTSLTKNPTSSNSAMISVTDYLFLGSVEAAFNEPLLCKYGITSLIDMTNLSPALIPAHKKSGCPCACVNKSHFRSKLNIGLDDIEWENIEQYFDEINAFIHGARKKCRRVLVYSYMGQSRAAAACIQHLMHHFRMPYKEALRMVRLKRPQVKLNSGFVKALSRLEKKLELQPLEQDLLETGHKKLGPKPELSPSVSRGSVEDLKVPPVVRGAWLEC